MDLQSVERAERKRNEAIRRRAEITDSVRRRLARRAYVESDEKLIKIEIELCKRSVVHLCNNWGWTFDPRNAEGEIQLPTTLPFDLFPRQVDFFNWLDERARTGTDGLVEKSRDSGFTWLCVVWDWHKWRFTPGFAGIFGSRKAALVDELGDPDSIFEKARIFMRNLPPWLLPVGYDSRRHDSSMKIINPENASTITGEAGDEMGRGGRATAYTIDESAFVDRMDGVDAATSATARFRIFGSTVNGTGNWFYRKRFGSTLKPDQVFTFDIADNPLHTADWIAEKEESLEAHTFASEYGRDYSASVEGICIPGKWVQSALEIASLLAARGISIEPDLNGICGADVGGGGKARSTVVARFGPIVTVPASWGDPDTNETAARALDYAEEQKPRRTGIHQPKVRLVNYDNVGVGHGCLGVMNRARPGIVAAGINVGLPPSKRTWPDGKTSDERFGNLKAELWFVIRERFKLTHEMVLFLKGAAPEKGAHEHPVSDLIVLPPVASSPDVATLIAQLSTVKWFRNENGKQVIETKKQLQTRGIASPDHAEALVLTAQEDSVLADWYGAFGKPGRR